MAFDHPFLTYAALTERLRGFAARHPDLAALASIGESHEGRDIWCLTLTNAATGPHDAKPAYFIDANIHAGEVTGSAVALETIRHLLEDRATDARARRLLDEMAVYVVPRVAVDGAEAYLTTPDHLRASTRAWPPGRDREGLVPQDLDGNGWIATMRVPDPAGAWKASTEDPRLMVPRAPDEAGGTYYWVLTEGMLTDHEPGRPIGAIAHAPKRRDLDLNRNFPAWWEPEGLTPGAGAYPLSEPEPRAVADFLLSHPNIAGTQHYHTFSGVILRPSSRKADRELAAADLRRYEKIGAIGEAETGYPCISLYEGFTPDKKKLYAGMLIDWAYDHLGLVTFSTELWSLGQHLGLKIDNPIDFYFEGKRTEADDLAMLRFCDEALGGFGFLPWTPFDHPQLGPVEIGGWQYKLLFQNAPAALLPEIARKNTAFTVRAALCSPRIALREVVAAAIAPGVHRVDAVVENRGYLPTSVTAQAVAAKAVLPDRVAIAGAEVVEGEAEREIGFLPGRDGQDGPMKINGGFDLPARRRVTWIVRAPEGAEITVTATSQRGGRDTAKVRL